MVLPKHLLQAFGNIFAFSSFFILFLISPLIGDGKRLKKVGVVSSGIYLVFLLLEVIALLFLIPSLSDLNNTLSIYVLARKVSIGDFVESTDAIFLFIWVMSIFCYLAIIMHYILHSFKKVVDVKHENALVYSFSAFLFVIAMLPKNVSDTTFFENTFYKYASIALVFFICFVILILAYIKKKRELKRGENSLEEVH